MESFLPSEIARLVYGYLEEEECSSAAQAFLETSSHLKECLAVAKKGRKFNTRILGLSLVDILDLLTEAISFVKDHSKECKEELKKEYRLLSLIQVDHFTNSSGLDSGSDKCGKNDDSVVQKPNAFGNRQTKNEDPLAIHPGDSYQKQEGPGVRVNSLFSSQKPENVDLIKVKEESDEDDYVMEDSNQNEEMMVPNIEPEVQISSPTGGDIHGNMTRQDAPTVNVITNPIMVPGRPPQLVCQPYSMVQMLPAGYPGSMSPNISAMYLPSNAIPQHQHPVMSVQASSQPPTSAVQSALYQTTVRTSSSNSAHTVWPKPKMITSQPQQNGSKLRPIAPKIVQSLENGVKVQVVHTKENPLVETNSCVSKRNLRSRKKPIRTIPSKTQSSSSVFVSDKK